MKVSIVKTSPEYPSPPYHPSQLYPEYPYGEKYIGAEINNVYDAVRKSLAGLGFDSDNFGKSAWNPFKTYIGEGSRIVIKPNFVNHYNLSYNDQPYFEALVTQAAVIRPLIDYVIKATNGNCLLTIADLPIQTADFNAIVQKTGLKELIEFVKPQFKKNGRIELADLRDYQMVLDSEGAILGNKAQTGDPLGYTEVDLASHSKFVPIEEDAHLFRAPDYKNAITVKAHSKGVHRYSISRTILESDFFINLPKLKVHRKTGVTLSLKNVVGTIGDKSCLPHYREGGPDTGGDEQAVRTKINSLRGKYSFGLRRLGSIPWRYFIRPAGRVLLWFNRQFHHSEELLEVTGGDWYGNDTIWRMVHDINSILFYADGQGNLHEKRQRHYLSVIDGIIGGEKEGPLSPRPVGSGIIAAGMDPIGLDVCCTRLMGLDWQKIPQYAQYSLSQKYSFSAFNKDLEQIQVRMMGPEGQIDKKTATQVRPIHSFEPNKSWKGHIELD